MMDHYEELGIERSASLAEIRHAYRQLMALLHPDHARDETSRRLAELQAKRLNAMLAVLTDPVERDRYDRQLSEKELALAPLPSLRTRWRAPGWWWPVVCSVVGLSLLSVMWAPQRGVPPIEAPPPPTPTVPVQATRKAPPPQRLFRRSMPPQISESSAREANEVLAPEPPRVPLESSFLVGTSRNDWETPAAIEAPSEPPRAPPRSGFAGDWLFLQESNVRRDGLYPPEYIELRVADEAGQLRGKYRARYQVTDRAISPAVEFEFLGRAGENEARLPWTGRGGAHGEVTLRLLTTGALEVTWVVSRLGNEMGLISGTATLVRKIE